MNEVLMAETFTNDHWASLSPASCRNVRKDISPMNWWRGIVAIFLRSPCMPFSTSISPERTKYIFF